MIYMERLIKKSEAVYLSDADIDLITRGEAKVVGFSSLKGVDDLIKVFGEKNCFILFYATESANVGHYTTFLLHRDKGVIEHWDSYGYDLDKLIKISDYENRQSAGENYIKNSVARACARYNLKFEENKKQFQKKSDMVSTCGRYACVRCIFRDLSLSQFNSMLDSERMPADWIVSALTVLFSESRGELIQLAK